MLSNSTVFVTYFASFVPAEKCSSVYPCGVVSLATSVNAAVTVNAVLLVIVATVLSSPETRILFQTRNSLVNKVLTPVTLVEAVGLIEPVRAIYI